MLGKLSIVGAVAAPLMIPAGLSAQPYGGPYIPGPAIRGGVVEGGSPVIGRRYHGGTWYGAGRRFWRGRWYAYGVGPCWRSSPIGFVWICS
jgi:hypothetical protein